jgi:transketolase
MNSLRESDARHFGMTGTGGTAAPSLVEFFNTSTTGNYTARVTLIASGSEVEIAVKARDLLEAQGVGTRVVSMPCWELFDEQEPAYREATLGPGTVKIAIEAAGSMGWERYIGPEGGFVGMQGFGASAPYKELYKHFGITAEAAAAAALQRLEG